MYYINYIDLGTAEYELESRIGNEHYVILPTHRHGPFKSAISAYKYHAKHGQGRRPFLEVVCTKDTDKKGFES